MFPLKCDITIIVRFITVNDNNNDNNINDSNNDKNGSSNSDGICCFYITIYSH